MIARLLRGLWCVALIVTAVAVERAIHFFGGLLGPWFAAAVAIMIIGAMHPAAVASCFLMSRIKGDPVPPAHRLSLWQAIKTYDAEIDASMWGVWIANPFREGFATPRPQSDAPPRRHALLFLHGYFCNRSVWQPFMKDAAALGYRSEALTLDQGHASIDSHAAAVDQAIDRLIADGAERVVIVAHSMGGLVVRASTQTIDHSRIAHVFTLGTPHAGTYPARFGFLTSVVQMRRDSPWLAALEARETNDGLGLPRDAYTTVFTYHDQIVYPQTTACLAGAECVALGGCGHVGLLYDRRVRTIVFDRLERIGQAGAAS